MLCEAAREVRLLGAQAVGVVLVLGRHALQALRAPVVDAPAKAHVAHTDASSLQRPLPCLCPHTDASTAREAAAATAPRREAAPLLLAAQRRSMAALSRLPKRQALWQSAEQKASVRNSLEQSAGSLIVYGRAEFEPRTHLAGLHVQVS